MAKENTVFLIGELQGSTQIRKDNQSASFVLKTRRRNEKTDYPIVHVLDETLLEQMRPLQEGDTVLVKGILATREVVKAAKCPHCEHTNKIKGTTTEVIPNAIIKMGERQDLEAVKEASNTVMLLGSLCREPEYRLLSGSSVPSCQYQLAINRKYNVKRQPKVQTDYPWVNSFAKQAEQDALRLQQGSQVFIQGGIQTRSIQRTVECEACKKPFKAEDSVAEVVPYSVEYLNLCKF